MDYISTSIIVSCALVNVACGTLGCFLVLRRMSLVGDAISHAVLPGIAIAFIATGSRDPFAMLIGSMIAGMVTVILMKLVQRLGGVAEDAAMGVVFTSLFAVGVILIHTGTGHGGVDLDPGCVLYGLVEFTPLDTVSLFGFDVSRNILTLGVATLLVFGFVALFWKELKITSFDPHLATTLGINASLVHYMLMVMVAIVTVAAFEAVGSILVVAAMIVPAATAALLTDRLGLMLVINALVGFVAAVVGREAALAFHSSVSGMVSVALGLMLLVAVFVAPRGGIVVRWFSRRLLQLRIEREHVLALLWRWNELHPGEALQRREILATIGHGLIPRLAISRLLARREIVADTGSRHALRLAPGGEDRAQDLVRRHRLWEMWLNRRLGVEPGRVHLSADRMEHFIDDALVKDVVDDVGFTDIDPHGKPIPWRDSDTQRFRVVGVAPDDDAAESARHDDKPDDDDAPPSP
ncbi:MAG: metal ABC transporter permease [Planctomycetota bacterium]